MKSQNLFQKAKSVNLQRPVQQDSFQESVYSGSVAKFNSILQKVEKLAKKGYGSVQIILDGTADMFYCKESDSTFYSEHTVINLLINEQFSLKVIEYHYDARTYILSWDKDGSLMQSNDLIPMEI
jgi:hypothetical protein